MDPFRLCLAFGPLGIYLLLLGVINLSRRPLLVSGARDVATLALALAGVIIIGPMELFFPFSAADYFGSFVWLLLLMLYALGVMLAVLWLRPRLTIYNISVDKMRSLLADAVERLDADARWAGDCLVLPQLHVQLYVDNYRAFRNVSLISAGSRQSQAGWRRLEVVLLAALAREDVTRNPRGLGLLLAGTMILAGLVLIVAKNPQAVSQSLLDVAGPLLKLVGL
jgi:uncharacterized membrane protein